MFHTPRHRRRRDERNTPWLRPFRIGTHFGHRQNTDLRNGKFALQSQGAVVAKIGKTAVLTTANAAKGVRDGIDFFPLTVDVEERAYAAGKIPGSFFRREGRPSQQAILTCRLTDRPLRPAFPDGYRNETQIVITVIGATRSTRTTCCRSMLHPLR